MYRKIFFILAFLFPLLGFSQGDVEMADTLRSEGKIYIVLSVIAVIVVGLLIYLISIDRKVNKIEKQIRK